jgi:hypothetical protein
LSTAINKTDFKDYFQESKDQLRLVWFQGLVKDKFGAKVIVFMIVL